MFFSFIHLVCEANVEHFYHNFFFVAQFKVESILNTPGNTFFFTQIDISRQIILSSNQLLLHTKETNEDSLLLPDYNQKKYGNDIFGFKKKKSLKSKDYFLKKIFRSCFVQLLKIPTTPKKKLSFQNYLFRFYGFLAVVCFFFVFRSDDFRLCFDVNI